MKYKSLLSILLLFGICSITSALIPTKQSVLSSSQRYSEPLVVKLNKKERTKEQKKELISFLQKATVQLQNQLLLQTNFRIVNQKETTSEPINVPIVNIMNTQYIGQISLGSTRDTFNVIFDTGSTALYVNSAFCDDYACLAGHQYDPSTSDTLYITDPPETVEAEYGSGILEGILAKEDLYLKDVKVPNFPIFLIEKQSFILNGGDFDGIVGLSFPDNYTQSVSVFDTFMNKLPQPMFSFHLRRNDEKDSYMMFGGYNKDHMASELIWHKVVDPNSWIIKVANIYVGDKATNFCKKFKCAVLIDSGASILGGPTAALAEIQNLIGNVSCTEISNLPTITFESENQKYDLTGDEYIMSLNEDRELEFFEHSKNPSNCSIIFTPMNLNTDADKGIFVLGDVFFTKYYVVFDRAENRIGLALQKR